MGKNAFEDALFNPRVEPANFNQYANLLIELHMQTLDNENVENYGRYWHGHLLFLKPLFVFFTLAQIKYLNLFLQVVLLAVILWMMYKRLGVLHCLVFLTALCFLDPVICWQCLEYQANINIMLCAILWILLNRNPNAKYGLKLFNR